MIIITKTTHKQTNKQTNTQTSKQTNKYLPWNKILNPQPCRNAWVYTVILNFFLSFFNLSILNWQMIIKFYLQKMNNICKICIKTERADNFWHIFLYYLKASKPQNTWNFIFKTIIIEVFLQNNHIQGECNKWWFVRQRNPAKIYLLKWQYLSTKKAILNTWLQPISGNSLDKFDLD